jgi:hypothetical protein
MFGSLRRTAPMLASSRMQVTLEIPEPLAKDLGDSPETVGRKFIEEYALNGYRAQKLTHYQVQLLLGLSGWSATEKFLRENGAPLHYGMKDLEEDQKTLDRILGQQEPVP